MRWTRTALPDQGARGGRQRRVVPTPQRLVSSSQAPGQRGRRWQKRRAHRGEHVI